MKITIVDENDNIIGYKDRNDRDKADICRVTGLWIYNSNKEVLIAQRTNNKVHDAGKWGPSVSGTVEEGETYISNIIKETKEEVGILINEKDLSIGSCTLRSTSHRYFAQRFYTKLDLPISAFIIQKDEVQEIRWIPILELVKWFNEKPQDFTASFERGIKDIHEFLK